MIGKGDDSPDCLIGTTKHNNNNKRFCQLLFMPDTSLKPITFLECDMTAIRKNQNLEDIERAAWYARLAFGICQEEVVKPAAAPEKPETAFYVIP
jgi:hypothetical protein